MYTLSSRIRILLGQSSTLTGPCLTRDSARSRRLILPALALALLGSSGILHRWRRHDGSTVIGFVVTAVRFGVPIDEYCGVGWLVG